MRQARLRVLGSFQVRISDGSHGADTTPPLALDERRLLAVLAVAATPRAARSLSALLWPQRCADVALGTLLGVRDSLADLVVEAAGTLRLADWVEVDLTHALSLLRGWRRDPFGIAPETSSELVDALGQDLLPSWSEGWVAEERARLRRVRLHALESLCVQLTALGSHELAIRAGMHVVQAEPLREGARRALIEAHFAAGNVSEAVHQYEDFVDTCAKLGVVPSADLSAFFPPSPAWPVLHVRRPIHRGGAVVGRGLWFDPAPRQVQAGAGSTRG
jgi:DNA-binding SARP family transcriptional activator